MDKWPEVEFGTLYEISSRNGLSKPSRVRGSGYKMINMGELFSNDRLYDIEMELVPLTSLEKVNAKVEVGDLLFARQSLVAAGAGKCSIVLETSELTVFESHLIRVRLKRTEADPLFYYYYFKSPCSTMRTIIEHCVQAGIKATDLAKLKVPVPPLGIQRNIGKILSVIDDKIEGNNRINKNLFEMVNAYYTSLFKDVECEMTTIGNYIERIYSGGTPTTSNVAYWGGEFGWFSSGETRNRFVISTDKTITQSGIDNSSTKLAAKYDIVMASAGQGFTRGQTSMLLIDAYVNQSVIVIHADRNIIPYLFWNLANRYEELRAISDSSSIRGSLTTKMIAAFEIPLANGKTIQNFSEFAWAVIPQIENNLLENERLAALRDFLLPKLMSGELDVSDIDI